MSRSQPTLQNPAKRFFDWSAKNGQVRYFDKNLGDKGENVTVKMPFRFLVLDQVSQIGGGKKVGHGKDKEFIGYYSNAVRKFDINKERFIVRSKGGIVGEGTYQEVKAITGAKLVAGLYIAFYGDDQELQIGYLKLAGSAMGQWFEFGKGRNVETGVISIERGEQEEDEQGNPYFLPKYSQATNISDTTEEAAIALDKELQTYLIAYFSKKEWTDAMQENGNGHSDYAPSHSGEPYMPPSDLEPPEEHGDAYEEAW